MQKSFIALSVVLSTTVLLTGCATSEPNAGQPSGETMVTDESTTYSPDDIMFAQMMIPHHQQALDISELALALAESPEVKELAAQIRDEQGPEISQMRAWLSAAGASEEMGHSSHGMDGMLTEEQMATLLSSSGADFEKLFLEGMISHHLGAIAMAQTVIDSANPEVRALAEAIAASQQVQIDFMETLLARL